MLMGARRLNLRSVGEAHDQLRSVALTESNCILVSLAASGEDVVEIFLLGSILFLIVSFSLIIEHFDNRFEIAMGSLVYLHLAFAIELQRVKAMEKRPLRFSDCLHSIQE
jgi:hypothetical protein